MHAVKNDIQVYYCYSKLLAFFIALAYPVKDVSVKVVVLCMDAKVLHRLWTLVREQLQDDVTQSCVKDCSLKVPRPGLVLLCGCDSIFV